MPSLSPQHQSHQSGFTLVEIMVGLAIGMLATLIILQVISMFESQKRVTTSTADAQTNGSIALYNIVRELNLSGYPLMPVTDSPLECTTLNVGTTGITSITPVIISNGAGGASDTITVRYGTSSMGGIPTTINAMGAPNPADATVSNNLGCAAGDIALLLNGTSCTLTSVSAVSAASTIPATISLADTTNAVVGTNISCLGKWNEVDFSINNGNLERKGVPIVAGIVSIQAQYGLSDSTNSNQITGWAEPNSINIANISDRNRVKALRIAVIARNAKKEGGNVTSLCSSYIASAPSGLCAWAGSASSPAPTIDPTTIDADWAHYRYRVFETIVPLRNVIWAKDTL